MKQLYKTLAAATIILSSFAHADTNPEFQQYKTPDVIPCEDTGRVMYGFPLTLCVDESRPGKHVVRYQNSATGEITMKEEETFEYLRCEKARDKCTDRSGNYRGKFTAPKDTYYAVFKDFYVYPGADGKVYGYKNGTGPLFGGAASSAPVTVPATASVKATPDEACSSKWVDAFHKENGEDAMITSDQLDEWDQWCAKGRLPN